MFHLFPLSFFHFPLSSWSLFPSLPLFPSSFTLLFLVLFLPLPIFPFSFTSCVFVPFFAFYPYPFFSPNCFSFLSFSPCLVFFFPFFFSHFFPILFSFTCLFLLSLYSPFSLSFSMFLFYFPFPFSFSSFLFILSIFLFPLPFLFSSFNPFLLIFLLCYLLPLSFSCLFFQIIFLMINEILHLHICWIIPFYYSLYIIPFRRHVETWLWSLIYWAFAFLHTIIGTFMVTTLLKKMLCKKDSYMLQNIRRSMLKRISWIDNKKATIEQPTQKLKSFLKARATPTGPPFMS